MKKLKLNALQLGATELLTREQLKNVLGGDGSDGSGDDGSGGWCKTSSTTCTFSSLGPGGIVTNYTGTCTTIVATVPYTDQCGCKKDNSEDKQVDANCKLTIS